MARQLIGLLLVLVAIAEGPDVNVAFDAFWIVPFAWNASLWWSTDQVLNLRAILDIVKRRYKRR